MAKIIAIDGPASVGKSTLAKKISTEFKAPVLYSGKLYRALALEIIKQKINLNNNEGILKCISCIDLDNLSSTELYSSDVDNVSSIISAKKQVRNKLIMFQRSFPKKYGNNIKFAIIEGRDIGTVIFPKANYKIFLWADAEIRAKRRYKQLGKNAKNVSYSKIFSEINVRDRKDMTRKIAPLMPAANSVLLDTSYIDIEQAFNALKEIILKA
jgi:cytidylate kinase|tara:strand:+ start:1239 stop:1874 length:636 start_codon:yes stop_codon:yes gene_type:complete